MDLNALQSTLAVAEHGGIAEANRTTGIPRSTLSRHLAEVERELGTRLIERSSRRFRLTTEGEALVALAGEPLAKLAEIGERLRPMKGNLTGRLRVSVPVMFGQTLLGQLAVVLADAHPDLFLDVVVDNRHVDILREGFDAALRVNPPSDSPLFGRDGVTTVPGTSRSTAEGCRSRLGPGWPCRHRPRCCRPSWRTSAPRCCRKPWSVSTSLPGA